MPRPDFPKTFLEFVRRFPDDDACWKYLVDSRWPEGVTCPDGHEAGFIHTRKLFQCSNGHQFSVTSGTIMHRSRLPLRVWFWGAYLMTTHTPGLSAVQFARQLDLNPEPAYMLLQKLRAAMVNPERGKIGGASATVEADEAFLAGGHEVEGRKGVLQTILAAVEVKRDNQAGRMRMQIWPTKNARDILRFLKRTVEEGTTVITDGSPSYKDIDLHGYRHAVEEEDVEYGLPHVHTVFSNFKSWWLGTHHGAIMHKHLQAYLNEYTFRFNRRHNPMAAFQTVLGIGTQVRGPTQDEIYSGAWSHPNPRRRRA